MTSKHGVGVAVPPALRRRLSTIAAPLLLACAGGVAAALLLMNHTHADAAASEGRLYDSASHAQLVGATYDTLSGQVEWTDRSGERFLTTLANPRHDITTLRRLARPSVISSVGSFPEDFGVVGLYLSLTLVYVAYIMVVTTEVNRRRVRDLPRWGWLLMSILFPPWGFFVYLAVESRSERTEVASGDARTALIIGAIVVVLWTACWTPG